MQTSEFFHLISLFCVSNVFNGLITGICFHCKESFNWKDGTKLIHNSL